MTLFDYMDKHPVLAFLALLIICATFKTSMGDLSTLTGKIILVWRSQRDDIRD